MATRSQGFCCVTVARERRRLHRDTSGAPASATIREEEEEVVRENAERNLLIRYIPHPSYKVNEDFNFFYRDVSKV